MTEIVYRCGCCKRKITEQQFRERLFCSDLCEKAWTTGTLTEQRILQRFAETEETNAETKRILVECAVLVGEINKQLGLP